MNRLAYYAIRPFSVHYVFRLVYSTGPDNGSYRSAINLLRQYLIPYPNKLNRLRLSVTSTLA
jgi:hypothetical protein